LNGVGKGKKSLLVEPKKIAVSDKKMQGGKSLPNRRKKQGKPPRREKGRKFPLQAEEKRNWKKES